MVLQGKFIDSTPHYKEMVDLVDFFLRSGSHEPAQFRASRIPVSRSQTIHDTHDSPTSYKHQQVTSYGVAEW